jgi:hypothetical protein
VRGDVGGEREEFVELVDGAEYLGCVQLALGRVAASEALWWSVGSAVCDCFDGAVRECRQLPVEINDISASVSAWDNQH